MARVTTEAKRQSIVDAARPLFFGIGYGALTMDMVAKVVGGSKATLYRYFPSKEALFVAVVRSTGQARLAELEPLEVDGDALFPALRSLGRAYMRLVLAPDVVQITRLIIAEARRVPEIGRLFSDLGPDPVIARLRSALATLADHHDLPALRTTFAATHFRALCEGDLLQHCLWGLRESVTNEELEDAVAHAALRFVEGYGCARSAPKSEIGMMPGGEMDRLR